MTRLFTVLSLLFATTFLFGQHTSFTGNKVTSDYLDSKELQHSFKIFDVYQIDVAAFDKYVKSAGSSMFFNMDLGDEYDWDISLEPRDMRKPGHLRRWTTGGGVEIVPPSENITFKGELEAHGGGTVSLTIDEELIRGFIKKDGEMYYIEPVWYFMKDAPRDLFVVYAASNVQPHPDVKCGVTALHDKTKELLDEHGHDHDHHHHGAEKAMGCFEIEIALASDWLMFQHFGSAGAVEGFMTGVLADVQSNFDDEFADILLFSIVEYFTVTDPADDPWTTSTNASTLLSSFTSWGPAGFNSDHDVGALWTDRDFNGGTIGIAWLESVCTNNKYHCLQNFSSNADLLRVLWAHELGHNFSLTHDAGGGFIMSPSVSNTNDWSGMSVSQMNSYYPTRWCIDPCAGAQAPVPVFSANPTEGCAPLIVEFTDQSEFSPTSWEWEFPGGIPGTSTDQHPVVEYNTPGIYDVTLTVENGAGSNSLTIPGFVVVNGLPETDFTYSQVGLTVIFANTTINGNTYLWEFGDGNSSTDVDPVHTYAQDGFYDVTLTAFNDCGDEMKTMTIPVFVAPTANFVASPTEGCAPMTVDFFSNASANTLAWSWEFEGGNPSTSDDENPTVQYTTPGVYDVKLTVTNPAGSDTEEKTGFITVGTIPTPGFTFSVMDSTVTFTNQSSNTNGLGTMSFHWDFGDGDTSIVANPVHTYDTSGVFDVTLEVTNDCGTVPITQQVTILLPPMAGFSAPVTAGCSPLAVTFENLSVGDSMSYEWDFPGGTPASSTDATPTVTYDTPGSYDVTLIATNTAGSDTLTLADYITVELGASPGFTSSTSGFTAMFTNTSTNATSYSWDFGDGNSSTDTDPTHEYANDGTYTVELTAFGDCDTVTISETVVIVTAPTAGFTADTTAGCASLTVAFTNQSSVNAVDYAWDFPGGNPSSSTDENPTVTYDMAGTYSVTLVVSNAAGSDTLEMTNHITVNTTPTAGYTSSVNANTATFTNTTTNATSYSWDFGDGNSSTDTNPTHEYTDGGTYEVVLSATNDCGTVTDTQSVTIVVAPTAGFSATPTVGCDPLTVTFTNESSANATSWEWDFPGGTPSSSTDENPTVMYDAPGTYAVTLTATNSAGSNSVTEMDYVTVNTVPGVGYTSSVNANTVTFTNTTTNGTSYSWDFGDGNSSTDANPVHEYEDEGSYTVVLSATNNCGTTLDTQTVEIVAAPVAGFTANQTMGCAPFTVEFTDQSSSNTTEWEWGFEGGMPATSTDQNPTVTYNTPGVYSVTLKAVNALGESTITETSYITVNTVPTSGFTSTSNMLQVDFTNSTTGATSYSWDFGDGNSSTDTDPVHTYEEDGTYEVVLTATNDCGSVTSTETVVVVSMPTAGFTADATNGCAPMTVQFSNNSSQNAETFEWSFPGGDPATSTEENPTVVYNTPGVFGVTLTVTNAAGSNTSNEVDFVTVNAAPATSFDHSISGNDVTFENTSDNFTSYSWDFGDGNTSDENNPTHTYESDGAYTVVLTTTNECGSTTFETVVVIATEGPIAAFTAMAEEGCAPFVVEFENLSSQNAETFEWTFEGGDPATSNEENPTVTYNAPGVYSVTLTVTNANGSDTSTEMDYIIVNDVPTPDFTSDANWQEISFTNTSTNGTTYSWDFGDGNTSTEADPTHTYEQEGEYEVTLTATNDCGFNTITQTVIVMANSTTEIPGISEFNIWPNPNNGRFSMTLQGEPLGNLDVYFTNVLGQVLLNEKIDFRSGSITKEFVFDDLAAGVYIFQLRSGNKSIHRKVVVD